MERMTRQLRTVATKFETREDGEAPHISGYFAVFNSNYEIAPGMSESIAPGAFSRTLSGDVRALIINPKWYIELNYWSLLDYDMKAVSEILLAGADRGYVCGDEWRDRMHMSPAGLKEFKVLENYIPADMSGNQKKLIQD